MQKNKFHLNIAHIGQAVRTLGALLLGNVLIYVFLLGNANWLALAGLTIAAIVVILAGSLEKKASENHE